MRRFLTNEVLVCFRFLMPPKIRVIPMKDVIPAGYRLHGKYEFKPGVTKAEAMRDPYGSLRPVYITKWNGQ